MFFSHCECWTEFSYNHKMRVHEGGKLPASRGFTPLSQILLLTIEADRPLPQVRNRINTIKPFVRVPGVWMTYAEHSCWFWCLLILELFQGILFLMMHSSGQNLRNSGKLKQSALQKIACYTYPTKAMFWYFKKDWSCVLSLSFYLSQKLIHVAVSLAGLPAELYLA